MSVREEHELASRRQKLELWRQLGFSLYPANFKRSHSASQVATLAEKSVSVLEGSEIPPGDEVSVAGRIMTVRPHGRLWFATLEDQTGKIQLGAIEETADKKMWQLLQAIDRGDIVGAEGVVVKTKRGEPTVFLTKLVPLAKALQPLPEKWHGLQDIEERFRKRYLDILMNPEIKELLIKKTKFWDTARTFMKEHGFLEIETPTLEVTTGGAEATPFKTYNEDFKLSLFLRISVGELWQKRLMAAGFPKTFEIGRTFRNEGTDANHLQEFTNLEFYWAYANYEDGMKLVEELYKKIAMDVFGKTKFETRGHKFDLGGKWKRIDYREIIKKETGIDVLQTTEKEIKNKLEELKIVYDGDTMERLVDTLWKHCRKQISGPVFLTGHPKLVSPLSKSMEKNPELTERFQIIIAGAEVGNGFSELNDPIDQAERFEMQQKLLKAGDKEAMMPDKEFVEMLEYGMPPTCGFGFGELLFAFLADKPLRETQFFPLMKPKNLE
ncbi:MAG TPA: lysine--tRNA ligase [Candidatus Veblenbacteria bacterium]|nr:lysine--tRNA ligase [Candidatus Veblenbacteria bacterium]